MPGADTIAHCTFTFVDFEQETATVSMSFKFDSGVLTPTDITDYRDAVGTFLAALSNASLSKSTVYLETFYTRVGPTKAGQYPNVEDKALLDFDIINGNKLRMQIPAPKDLVFMSDQETVNKAQTNVADLITDATSVDGNGTYWVDQDGDKVQEYNFGYRRRTRSRREKPGRYTAIG